MTPTRRVLRYRDLAERKGIPWSRQHLARLEAKGAFPSRVQLGENSVGWVESEVDAWIASRDRGPLPLKAARAAKAA